MMKVAVFLACVVAACAMPGKTEVGMPTFTYGNCGPPVWPINLIELSIFPDPLIVPGTATFNLTITGDVGVTSPSPGSFIVTYHNTTTDTWDNVPCIDGPTIKVGSCEYDDSCSILAAVFPDPLNCPQAFIDAGVPCNCPFQAGTIKLVNAQIETGPLFSVLPTGEYVFKFSLYEANKARQIGCINIGGDIINNT